MSEDSGGNGAGGAPRGNQTVFVETDLGWTASKAPDPEVLRKDLFARKVLGREERLARAREFEAPGPRRFDVVAATKLLIAALEARDKSWVQTARDSWTAAGVLESVKVAYTIYHDYEREFDRDLEVVTAGPDAFSQAELKQMAERVHELIEIPSASFGGEEETALIDIIEAIAQRGQQQELGDLYRGLYGTGLGADVEGALDDALAYEPLWRAAMIGLGQEIGQALKELIRAISTQDIESIEAILSGPRRDGVKESFQRVFEPRYGRLRDYMANKLQEEVHVRRAQQVEERGYTVASMTATLQNLAGSRHPAFRSRMIKTLARIRPADMDEIQRAYSGWGSSPTLLDELREREAKEALAVTAYATALIEWRGIQAAADAMVLALENLDRDWEMLVVLLQRFQDPWVFADIERHTPPDYELRDRLTQTFNDFQVPVPPPAQ